MWGPGKKLSMGLSRRRAVSFIFLNFLVGLLRVKTIRWYGVSSQIIDVLSLEDVFHRYPLFWTLVPAEKRSQIEILIKHDLAISTDINLLSPTNLLSFYIIDLYLLGFSIICVCLAPQLQVADWLRTHVLKNPHDEIEEMTTSANIRLIGINDNGIKRRFPTKCVIHRFWSHLVPHKMWMAFTMCSTHVYEYESCSSQNVDGFHYVQHTCVQVRVWSCWSPAGLNDSAFEDQRTHILLSPVHS